MFNHHTLNQLRKINIFENNMKNNVQLITYVDRLTGTNVEGLNNVLNNQFKGLFSGVHLLPFYYPIDGSDAGFDPIDHTAVDSRIGTWKDVQNLGESYDVMADLIVNHMSAESAEFQDVIAKGKNSEFWDLFLTKDKVFPNGLSNRDRNKIYRPRPGSCFTQYTLTDGTVVDFWTTFTSTQIDIDVNSDKGKDYLHRILSKFSENNIKTIRLDAAGYAIKKAGTKCFMLEETFEFINELTEMANKLGIETLVEIHSYYETQINIASRVDQVYDFALPPLILHSLFNNDFIALENWLKISPKNCITVLDTHDGIGIIDVGPMGGKQGLLNNEEIDKLVKQIHINSNGESNQATGAAASNVDLYQVNCTYYDALAQNDLNYLAARAIQFFAPGIPQVYYSGLLSSTNDMELLTSTNVGRDINRPYLSIDDITVALKKTITKALKTLIKLRNESTAFSGEFNCALNENQFVMSWKEQNSSANLMVNLTEKLVVVNIDENGIMKSVNLGDLLAE
jgi:sucrose phosphorylase